MAEKHWPVRRIVRLVLELAARSATVLIAIGTIAWLVGRFASDRWGWSQWLLWMPTILVLVASALAAVLALRPRFRESRVAHGRRRRFAAWSAVALALAVYFLFIEHHFARVPGKPAGLSVTHWTMTYSRPRDLAVNARTLIELSGDVTVLSHDTRLSSRPEVLESLGESGRIIRLWPFTVLTRLPVLEARPLVSNDEIWAAMIELDAREQLGESLVIVMVDLPSDPRLPRAGIAARLRAGLNAADAPEPDLVLGDFNMTRGSASIRSIFPEHVHAFDLAGHGYGASFHRNWLLYHIDQMLLRAPLRASRYELVDPGFGRHLAQRCWVTCDSEAAAR